MTTKLTHIYSYPKYWAARFTPAPLLPMSLQEMLDLGWDACDIILVSGDAYVDHPSFGMAVIGRLLESQGFRVGIISQPRWQNTLDFEAMGPPRLFFGITAGNMDSMVNHYTADKRIRSNDAYTPDGAARHRPDRAVIVYSHRCREAYPDVPIVIGGIEASLRRIAHFDYWSEKVRRSIIFDAKADLLVYGNAERQITEIAHRVSRGEHPRQMQDIRGTAFVCDNVPPGWAEISPNPGVVHQPIAPENPYAERPPCDNNSQQPPATTKVVNFNRRSTGPKTPQVVRLPSFEAVSQDTLLYAQASRMMHLETNPGNARPLAQSHGDKLLWVNPPPIPLATKELDFVFELPYTRQPHRVYESKKIPAYDMIRFSVNIMRGCFGGCTFCSITEHEGRIIQSRSEASVLKEIETIRDTVPGFTGVVSDMGGPTANMYRMQCKSQDIEKVCRRLSCVYPVICENLNTDHTPLIQLYRRARALPGVKKICIASGLRYDLAVRSPEYVKELVTHHVGGYLKIAPEHTEAEPLSKMMKPGMGAYEEFKKLFDHYSKAAGKEQYLIPYFIAAHPGTSDTDMLNLALWLKSNGFRADQVQAFLPSPMALATTMYHTQKNPLKRLSSQAETVYIPKGLRQRRLHKALLRYHDAENWPLIRTALKTMGRADLIGNGKAHLVPLWQPQGTGQLQEGKRLPRKAKRLLTQHQGLRPLKKLLKSS